MSTNVECTNCNDVVAVDSRNIELPFVCNDCELRAAMAPIAPAKIPAFPDIDIKSYDEFPLNDDDATVENTTLLIEDLEQQLAGAKELQAVQQEYILSLEGTQKMGNALIEDMSKQLTDDAEVIGGKDRELAGLDGRYSDLYKKYRGTHELNERLQNDMGSLMDKLKTLRSSGADFALKMLALAGEWDEERERLENKLVLEKQSTANLEAELRANKMAHHKLVKEYWTLYYSNERLRERGFFARLFNR